MNQFLERIKKAEKMEVYPEISHKIIETRKPHEEANNKKSKVHILLSNVFHESRRRKIISSPIGHLDLQTTIKKSFATSFYNKVYSG